MGKTKTQHNFVFSFLVWIWMFLHFKGALDKYNIIPQLFPKKSRDFYTIRSVCMGKDCMLSFMFQIDLLLKKFEYF